MKNCVGYNKFLFRELFVYEYAIFGMRTELKIYAVAFAEYKIVLVLLFKTSGISYAATCII